MLEDENGTRGDQRRLIGYARVSSADQNLDLQIDALTQHRCERVFVDKASGAKSDRPGLAECVESLVEGDVLLVWRLDRLGRSMVHLVALVDELRKKGIGFRSINDGSIDTTTASGELVFNIFSSLAQFERRLIQERTQAGLAAARARGRTGGRKRITADDPRVQMAVTMHADKKMPVTEICKTLKISRTSFYRYVDLAFRESKSEE